MLADYKLKNLPNFKFLPPINKVNNESIDLSDYNSFEPYQIAEYTPWYGSVAGEAHMPNYAKEYENCLMVSPFYEKSIDFDPTSKNNNLVLQAFEISADTMFKLDVIDYGKWTPKDKMSIDKGITQKHFFFVGKMMRKNNTGTDAFIHLFTIVFG